MPLQFMALNNYIVCPICDSTLTLVKEYDSRVALLRHEARTNCPFYWKQYRVDRITGHGEEFGNAQESTEVQVPSHGVASDGTLGQG